MAINRSRLAVLKRRHSSLVVGGNKALNRIIRFTELTNKYDTLSSSITNNIENQDFIVGVWQEELAGTKKPWVKIKAASRIAWHTAKKVNFIARRIIADSNKNYYSVLRDKASVKHLNLENERTDILEKINSIESGIK